MIFLVFKVDLVVLVLLIMDNYFLKINLIILRKIKKFVVEGNEIFKPGYTRLNLPYFYPKFIIEYIKKAIKFICVNEQLFIGLYNYDIKSGKFFFYDYKKRP